MGDAELMEGLAGIFAGMFATFGIFMFVFCALLIVAQWKVFTKAGEPGGHQSFHSIIITCFLKLLWAMDYCSYLHLFQLLVLSQV